MTHDELVERVSRVISEQLGDDWDDNVHAFCGDDWGLTPEGSKETCRTLARSAIAVVLEEAAKIAEDKANRLSQYRDVHSMLQVATAEDIADEIRQLKGDK
jgi:hypothetical protein